jgi:hypothetical protein
MITGMSRSATSPLSADSTLQPSMPGIITSRVMAAGRMRRASWRPSAPPLATRTEKPSFCK